MVCHLRFKKKYHKEMRGSLQPAWSQDHKDKQGQKICLVSSSFANFFVCEVIYNMPNLFIKEHLFSQQFIFLWKKKYAFVPPKLTSFGTGFERKEKDPFLVPPKCNFISPNKITWFLLAFPNIQIGTFC